MSKEDCIRRPSALKAKKKKRTTASKKKKASGRAHSSGAAHGPSAVADAGILSPAENAGHKKDKTE